jgi:bacterioferritin
MTGDAKIIDNLNQALSAELTAINQYILHSEICANLGFDRMAGYIKKRAIGEMKHAEALVERILFLEGDPEMTPAKLKVGKTLPDILKRDLAIEMDGAKIYRDGVSAAEDASDFPTRDLFSANLRDEEEHINWIEGQISALESMGEDIYAGHQLHD